MARQAVDLDLDDAHLSDGYGAPTDSVREALCTPGANRTTPVEHDLQKGRLVRPFKIAQSCELAYYLVDRKASTNSAPVVAFREWLIEEAGSA